MSADAGFPPKCRDVPDPLVVQDARTPPKCRQVPDPMAVASLSAEEDRAIRDLERAGEEWIEARAGGRPTVAADEQWRAAMTEARRCKRRREKRERLA